MRFFWWFGNRPGEEFPCSKKAELLLNRAKEYRETLNESRGTFVCSQNALPPPPVIQEPEKPLYLCPECNGNGIMKNSFEKLTKWFDAGVNVRHCSIDCERCNARGWITK
jgi:hypothetical protein